MSRPEISQSFSNCYPVCDSTKERIENDLVYPTREQTRHS